MTDAIFYPQYVQIKLDNYIGAPVMATVRKQIQAHGTTVMPSLRLVLIVATDPYIKAI